MRRADPPPSRQTGFGHPALFDLTALERRPPPAPTVVYLVPEVAIRDRPATWRTVAGFSAVIAGGLGLGLLLAAFLL